MAKKKTDGEQSSEPQVTEEALHDRIKVHVKNPDNPDLDHKYEVTGDQACEWLAQMFAVRGTLTPRMHNLIGSIKTELAQPVKTT